MGRRSVSWKALERQAAKELGGERVLRGADFSKKDVDVRIPDFPTIMVDAKYRQRWYHHRFLAEVVTKYCDQPDCMPLLITKHPRQRGAVAVLYLDHLGALLDTIRDLRDELAQATEKGDNDAAL